MRVCTVEESQKLRDSAIREYNIPAQILLENAGQAVIAVLHDWVSIGERSFVVICGPDDNGAVGMAVARKLGSLGAQVEAMILADVSLMDGPWRTSYHILSGVGVDVVVQPTSEIIEQAIASSEIIIDALLGPEIDREVSGQYREVIEQINRSGRPVLSVDIPSGVDGNTGRSYGFAVHATRTVALGLPRVGNLLYPGAQLGGELFISPIDYPLLLQSSEDLSTLVNLPPPLPERRPDAHKGNFGEALFIAGAAGYLGAPILSSLAMLKAGGGYARLATPRSIITALAGIGSEVVFVPQPETPAGSLSPQSTEALLELSSTQDFVVLGPGLSLSEEAQTLVRQLTRTIARPLLLDGDGLTAVASDLGLVSERSAPTILTPHPGELSRLTGLTVSEIMSDPLRATRLVARELRAIVVLKIAHSLIALPDGTLFINTTGNSAMASAGSGDVLTGTIAAMYGLGLSLEDAVRTGVFVHGLAGDLAACEKGADGTTARDVLEHLPAATRAYRENHRRVLEEARAYQLVP